MSIGRRYLNLLTKEYLQKAYIDDKCSITDIVRELGVAFQTVQQYLQFHGIPIRKGGLKEKDLLNQKFGMLHVIKRIGRKNKKSRSCRWLCECVCGKNRIVDSHNLIHGITKSCGCLRKRLGPSCTAWHGGKYFSGTFFCRLKANAANRCRDVAVTLEDIEKQFEKQGCRCALSGIELNEGNASVDRIDNNKGYIVGNIQWLHKDINRMKWTHEQDYFVEMCKMIAVHQGEELT